MCASVYIYVYIDWSGKGAGPKLMIILGLSSVIDSVLGGYLMTHVCHGGLRRTIVVR